MQIIRRRRRLYLVHILPEAVRPYFGKVKLSKTLGTENMADAEIRAVSLKVQWRAQIEQAREALGIGKAAAARKFWAGRLAEASSAEERATIEALIAVEARVGSADVWRATLAAAPASERAGVIDLIADAAREIEEDASAAITGAERLHPAAQEAAQAWFNTATGRTVPLRERIDAYVGALDVSVKEKKQRRRILEVFTTFFPLSSDVERRRVQEWVEAQLAAGDAAVTVHKRLRAARLFFTWLVDREEIKAPEGRDPFKVSFPKLVYAERDAWEPSEVVGLVEEALARDDKRLASAIVVAAHYGMRIEELCNIRVGDVREHGLDIHGTKTKAARRTVPHHPAALPVVEWMAAQSQDGFLVSGYNLNSNGERSKALSKAFSELKKSMGYGPSKVFHSFRNTVATLLDDASIPKQHAAKILGHSASGITFKLYSKGARLETLREALVRAVDYPGMAPLIEEITR